MKLLIIRHGEPDYGNDTLTEKGWQEAECLAQRLYNTKIDYIYESPQGRAKDTASLTIEKKGMTAKELWWLREFAYVRISRPDRPGVSSLCWDWMPADWTEEERFFQYDHWTEPSVMEEGGIGPEYTRVVSGLDELLSEHGYVREGHCYRVVSPNHDTIALFCHFGVECVILSHLMNVSPMTLWHGCMAATASVTSVVTEERQEGISSFRMLDFGDISHLYAGGLEPSYVGRFKECFADEEYSGWIPVKDVSINSTKGR